MIRLLLLDHSLQRHSKRRTETTLNLLASFMQVWGNMVVAFLNSAQYSDFSIGMFDQEEPDIGDPDT